MGFGSIDDEVPVLLIRWSDPLAAVPGIRLIEIIMRSSLILFSTRKDSSFIRYLLRNAQPPGVPVGWVLREGELVSGFHPISTPGHTLGHASLLRDLEGLLFTADAFGYLPRKMGVGVRNAFCADPLLAKRSAEKLLRERFATVVMAHGPVLREDARTNLQEAVACFRY